MVGAVGDEELAIGGGEVDAGGGRAELAGRGAVRAKCAYKPQLRVRREDGDAVVARVGAEEERAGARALAGRPVVVVQREADGRVQLAGRLAKRADGRDRLELGERELVQPAVASVGDVEEAAVAREAGRLLEPA